MINIEKIANKLGLSNNNLFKYGDYISKIKLNTLNEVSKNDNGKLILVTAINPTKTGEGKTTVSIGLHDALNKLNQKSILCLREPSMGPVFGLKGGATGGGKASICPSDKINLHFTGDIHALTYSINLISAVIDNHIFQGNELNIKNVIWNRSLDVNDRELRTVEVGLHKNGGIKYKTKFELTVANELMAIFCLSKDLNDLKNKINNIIIGYDSNDKAILLEKLNITNAIMNLLVDAFNPNLVQTLEGNPCLVHGGPFANIAHGTSSLIGTKLALKLAPLTIIEAGFGSDLGAEKFCNIKCRLGEIKPDACVIVATIKALKSHGGLLFEKINDEDLEALKEGFKNLLIHNENMKKFGLSTVIALNLFDSDTKNEVGLFKELCVKNNLNYAITSSFVNGGAGCIDLANKVLEIVNTNKSKFKFLYDNDASIEGKINIVCKEIYRADGVNFDDVALNKIKNINDKNILKYPICIAKTPFSLSDNKDLINVPHNFKINVKDIKINNGAGFIVVYTGDILTMPGLPKVPSATKFIFNI